MASLRRPQSPSSRLVSALASVSWVTLVACSGATTEGTARSDDGGAGADGARSQSDGTYPDAALAEDAGFCNDLQSEAASALEASSAQYLTCTADSDCVYTAVGLSGACAAACGVLSSASSSSAAVAAAVTACQTFNADGCPPPEIACPAPPPVVCAGGACTAYTLFVTQSSSTLVHGQCGAFALGYDAFGSTPDAPHAVAETLTTLNGTLYADAQCTQSLGATGSVSVPAGATQGSFGFVPEAAGPVRFTTNRGMVYSYTAE